MALHHAAPGEIVNLATWADDIRGDHSKAIAKTREVELARLVMRDGDIMEEKHVDGPMVIHCLSGCLEVRALGLTQRVGGGELLYLPPAETFTIKPVREALVLVTFIFYLSGPGGGTAQAD